MAEKKAALKDFKAIITELNKIISGYRSGSYSAPDMADSITVAYDLIANVITRDEKIQQKFGEQSSKLVLELTLRPQTTGERLREWISTARYYTTLSFMSIAANSVADSSGDEELDIMLVDFFDGEDIEEVTAHYFAAARLGSAAPVAAYNLIVEDFGKYPDMLSQFYKNYEYVYDPVRTHDNINEICPVCGSERSEPYFCANQALRNDSRFSPAKLWLKCKECGNLFAYNFPAEPLDRNPAGKGGTLTPQKTLGDYSDIFNNIRSYNSGRKYLEVGVRNGEMLASALEMGYEADAVDICKKNCENISEVLGVAANWCDFLDFDTDKRYDVINLGDIPAHISQPIEALQKAHGLLEDNGILWLCMPNFNSAYTRMLKFSAPMWSQPNHIICFSFEGLKPFLDKAGFDVKRYDISKTRNGCMELILHKR